MRFYKILFLVIISFMVIISLFTYYSYRQLSEEYLALNRADEINDNLERTVRSLDEAQAFTRGYVLTGDQYYFQSLENSIEEANLGLRKLEAVMPQLSASAVKLYTPFKQEVYTQINSMLALANDFHATRQLNTQLLRQLRESYTQLDRIKEMHEALSEELTPPDQPGYGLSRTLTPLLIIIGYLAAVGAIIYLYIHLYKSLQSNLATEMQLESNLIELGQEIQERVEAETLVERILDSSESSVMLLRPIYKGDEITDFRIDKCNRQSEVQTGLSRKVLEGSKLLEYFPGAVNLGLFDEYVSSLQTGKEFRRELLYDLDDLHLYIDIHATPLDDGLVISSTDISDRVRILREIERNHQKFSTLFQQSFQYIALVNHQGEISDINQSFLEYLGETSDRLIGQCIYELAAWPEDTRETLKDMFSHSLVMESVRKEVAVRLKEGGQTHLDFSFTKIPGTATPMIIFEARDITELYWAREEHEFLADLNVAITHAESFNHAAKVIFNKIGQRYDLDSTEVWVPEGKRYVRMLTQFLFDPSRQELESEKSDVYLMPRDSGFIGKILRDRKMMYVPDINKVDQHTLHRKNFLLKKGYRSIFGIPIIFNGEVLLVAIFLADQEIEDIDELKNTLQIMSSSLGALLVKKKVQDELRQNNLILGQAEKLAKLGSWEWHLQDNTVTWSEGMYRIFEKDPEFVPTFHDFLDLVYGKDRELVNDELMKAISTKDIYEIDFRMMMPDKSFKYVRATGHPLRNNFGMVQSYTGTIQDISAQKRHEIELHEKNEELKDTNKNLEQFAYIASHDLQEPLRKIRAFGDRLKDKYRSVLDETGADYLERMQNAAERMQTLINDLLKYSRVARNIKPFTPTDLNIVLKGVMSDLETLIRDKDVEISSQSLPVILGDDLQLRQLLQNLISNAIKFVPEGKRPKVQIWSEPVMPERNLKGLDGDLSNYISLNVQDNGIGVEKKYQERIFGLFERLHGRSEYSGTGIGLAICQRVVQNHNGQILVDSEPGQGTRFEILLPKGVDIESTNVEIDGNQNDYHSHSRG